MILLIYGAHFNRNLYQTFGRNFCIFKFLVFAMLLIHCFTAQEFKVSLSAEANGERLVDNMYYFFGEKYLCQHKDGRVESFCCSHGQTESCLGNVQKILLLLHMLRQFNHLEKYLKVLHIDSYNAILHLISLCHDKYYHERNYNGGASIISEIGQSAAYCLYIICCLQT